MDKPDPWMGLLGHGSWPQPGHTLGLSECVLVGPWPCQNQASPPPQGTSCPPPTPSYVRSSVHSELYMFSCDHDILFGSVFLSNAY